MLILLKLTVLHMLLCTHKQPIDIYTLSLHDALPISAATQRASSSGLLMAYEVSGYDPNVPGRIPRLDRKSTRLNSSHRCISYAVFCLKTKKESLSSA